MVIKRKTYRESGLESLQHWHWYRKLYLFYKIFKENKDLYLSNLIPTKILYYNTRNTDKITLFHTQQNFFKHCFFSQNANSVFNYYNWKEIKYFIRLFFNAPCLVIKDAPSWEELVILIVLWLIYFFDKFYIYSMLDISAR